MAKYKLKISGLLLTVLFGCGSGNKTPELRESEPVDRAGLVDSRLDISAINAVRDAEFSPYSALDARRKLTVDTGLITLAQQRAATLIATQAFAEYDYSAIKLDSLLIEPEKDIGEIRYLSEVEHVTVADAVLSWQQQGSRFDISNFDINTKRYITACSDSEPCYNYAQIVTDRASKVGCAADVYEQGPLAGQSVMVCLFDKTFVPRYRAYNMFGLSESEHDAYTNSHNQYRANHYQNKDLYFNEILQLEAQDFADISAKIGLWRHSTGSNEKNPALVDQGEHFLLSGRRSQISGTIDAFYNNELHNLIDGGASGRSECQQDKECGHTPQVAWQETRLVGCAQSFYQDSVDGNKKNNWITVCRYWPRGGDSGTRFACPSQGNNDILEDAPYLALPYTANDILPFTDTLLNKELVLIEHLQSRKNSSNCAINQGPPALMTLDLVNQISGFTMKAYNYYYYYNKDKDTYEGDVRQTSVPLKISNAVYHVNALGQILLTGVTDSFWAATVEMTITILSQRADGSYIVELEYKTDEQGSGKAPGHIPDASGRGIYLME